jgi:hypothetical protein
VRWSQLRSYASLDAAERPLLLVGPGSSDVAVALGAAVEPVDEVRARPAESAATVAVGGVVSALAPTDEGDFLAACFRVLRPGGSLLLATEVATGPDGAGLEASLRTPLAHLRFPQAAVDDVVRRKTGSAPRPWSPLTAGARLLLLHRVGFDLVEVHRLESPVPLAVDPRLSWLDPNELAVRGLVVHARRPARTTALEDVVARFPAHVR